jgi:hypothetical protein
MDDRLMADNPTSLPLQNPEPPAGHTAKRTFFLRIGNRRIGFRQTVETFDAPRGPATVIELPLPSEKGGEH